jgi:hypothetical protein
MNDHSILDVGLISYPDFIDVSTHNSVEPHGTLFSHDYISHHGGIIRNPAVFSPLRCKSPDFFYKGHLIVVEIKVFGNQFEFQS